MELNATSPAQYSVSPLARSFQTMTMAMQRARPIRMSPTMYSGLSRRKITASANIRIGPTTQFCTSESASTLPLRKTSGSSSYRTLASGGYIIRMSPMAMGIEVVPTLSRSRAGTTPGTAQPSSDARAHGEEDPEGQVAVEEGEAAGDAGVLVRGGSDGLGHARTS